MEKEGSPYVLLDGEPEAQTGVPVYNGVVTDAVPEVVPLETPVYLDPEPSEKRRKNGCLSCCVCFTGSLLHCCAALALITGLITLWFFLAYGQTEVKLPTIKNLEYSINADATAILTNGESMGSLQLRIQNVNNFDVTFKEPEVLVKIKQGGHKKRLAKYSSSKSITLRSKEMGNIPIDYIRVVNETSVWDLQTTCINKGWAKLSVSGHLRMKGGAHTEWSRQSIESDWNKCIPCQCNGMLYCNNTNPNPNPNPDDDDEIFGEETCWD